MRRRSKPRHGPAPAPPGAAPAPPRARPAAPGTADDVLLAWARDRDGKKVHALRLDPADRRRRAPFTCLGCGDELVPHLGKVRRPHFAHRAGSACPLTAPETALHLDAKERLLALCEDAFAGRRRVTLLARCPSCRRAAPRDLAREGDRALTEGAVGALRADVLVLAGERPALALEVVVTHAVDAEKEAALAVAAVPAVEIDARAEWEGEDAEGVAVACLRSLGFPPCPACAAEARADADRALGGERAEIAELEAYRARGFFGARPALPSVTPSAADAPLSSADRAALSERFRCPACGSGELRFGERIARHLCPDRTDRPVAWRGYDGTVVALSWWRR
ncbi:competence protein CoiA family protein [Anaeromyxobacter terrae]|uniref:competence protein CoiA family protein n=1 Tax=Anaeromyxobacter terrae TaxID=2925406 RepID=UPI001F5835B2|nr:competence protein CoiA family protein [Anaeromyxobacter sp. SG22]